MHTHLIKKANLAPRLWLPVVWWALELWPLGATPHLAVPRMHHASRWAADGGHNWPIYFPIKDPGQQHLWDCLTCGSTHTATLTLFAHHKAAERRVRIQDWRQMFEVPEELFHNLIKRFLFCLQSWTFWTTCHVQLTGQSFIPAFVFVSFVVLTDILSFVHQHHCWMDNWKTLPEAVQPWVFTRPTVLLHLRWA